MRAAELTMGRTFAVHFDHGDDFYPALRASFTYQDKLYCIPKDFSTLALEINTAAWNKAGLTDVRGQAQSIMMFRYCASKTSTGPCAPFFSVMPVTARP